MKYPNVIKQNRPDLVGMDYWLWRLARTRVEELPWIIRRIFRINHITSGYYNTPKHWLTNGTRARDIAFNVRGDSYPPVVFVHGITPRCGSNLVHDVVDCHPDVIGRQLGISEFPVLCNSRAMDAFYSMIVARHREVAKNISGIETMAFLVSGWMRDLQSRLDDGTTAVLKMPSVQHLELFDVLFPRDRLVIVIRDGRDILQSTVDSWRGDRAFMRSEAAIAREYAAAAQCVTSYIANSQSDYHVFRYEDYISNPKISIGQLYKYLRLSADSSLIESAASLPLKGSSSVRKDGKLTWEPVDKPANFKPVKKWRNWNLRRKMRFSKFANQGLVDLGYETDAGWVTDCRPSVDDAI